MGRNRSLFLRSRVSSLVSFALAASKTLTRRLTYGAHGRSPAAAFRGTPCAAEAREQGVAGGDSPPQTSV